MITGIVGPMFSGKSSELLRLLERKHIAGKKCLLIRPTQDTRGFVARGWSNDTVYKMSNVKVMGEFKKEEIPSLLAEYDAIFVDEFWMIKNNSYLCEAITEKKIDIYFCGIWTNVNNELWPEAIKVIPYFDEVIKLSAVCKKCGSEHANYNIRIDNNIKVATDIGAGVGSSEYEVLCRKCFLKRKRMQYVKGVIV